MKTRMAVLLCAMLTSLTFAVDNTNTRGTIKNYGVTVDKDEQWNFIYIMLEKKDGSGDECYVCPVDGDGGTTSGAFFTDAEANRLLAVIMNLYNSGKEVIVYRTETWTRKGDGWTKPVLDRIAISL